MTKALIDTKCFEIGLDYGVFEVGNDGKYRIFKVLKIKVLFFVVYFATSIFLIRF